MKHLGRAMALAATFALVGPLAAAAQEVQRTELKRENLSGSDTLEVRTARLVIPPGARVPLHTHHGDEHSLVVQGGPVTLPNGKTAEFPTGMPLFFPAGQVHGGITASGPEPVVLFTVHIVEKGKPLNEPAE